MSRISVIFLADSIFSVSWHVLGTVGGQLAIDYTHAMRLLPRAPGRTNLPRLLSTDQQSIYVRVRNVGFYVKGHGILLCLYEVLCKSCARSNGSGSS